MDEVTLLLFDPHKSRECFGLFLRGTEFFLADEVENRGQVSQALYKAESEDPGSPLRVGGKGARAGGERAPFARSTGPRQIRPVRGDWEKVLSAMQSTTGESAPGYRH